MTISLDWLPTRKDDAGPLSGEIGILGAFTALLYLSLYVFSVTHVFELLLVFSLPVFIWIFLMVRLPKDLKARQGQLVLFWALVFRLLLLPLDPLFEDDYFRYLWDGYTFSTLGNPYMLSPLDIMHAISQDQLSISPQALWILNQVSYPDIKTVYGPVFELVFLGTYKTFGLTLSGWQYSMFIIEVLFLVLLYSLVSKKLFFAISWLPLSIFNFSINLHADLIALVFVLVAFHAYKNTLGMKSTLAQDWVLGAALALACLSKIFAVFLVPFFFVLRPKITISFVLTLALVYFPFLVSGRIDLQNIIELPAWSFNSPFQYMLDSPFHSLFQWGTRFSFAILFFLSILQVRRTEKIRYLEALYFLFFLSGATLNSWYLVWLLIPVSLREPDGEKPFYVWLLSTSFFLSYVTGLGLNNTNLGLYEVAPVALYSQYGVVLLFLLLQKSRERFS